MQKPDLIFCGGKNPSFAEIAISAGFLYGAQLPCTVYAPVYFADQDWKNPDRKLYMDALEKHRPFMASVLDLENENQFDEVISWAEEASRYAKVVMIIPKVNLISKIPKIIGNSFVRLGYSVPTTHGGTDIPVTEFRDWDVHLLGGSPGHQMRLSSIMKVVSVDGNMAMKMANRGLFWERGKKEFSNHWTSLKEADGERWPKNGNHEAFRRSCENIRNRWTEIAGDSQSFPKNPDHIHSHSP